MADLRFRTIDGLEMNGSSWLNEWIEECCGNFPEAEYRHKGTSITHVYSGKKTKPIIMSKWMVSRYVYN